MTGGGLWISGNWNQGAPYFISTWDSGQPLASWDAGLSWDVNVAPSLGGIANWMALITSEHASKPKFTDTVAATLQPLADIIAILESIPRAYDLDVAVGTQLDTDGQWIGASRNISVPLEGVFFSWDTPGLGWDEGNWIQSINETQLVTLADAQYRTLLYAKVAANHWNGTIPGAYAVWDTIFAGTPNGILIQDVQGMHMIMALTGPLPDAVTQALFTSGLLQLKPAGVRISFYLPAESDVPYFGYDCDNDNIAGWGTGYWAAVGGSN